MLKIYRILLLLIFCALTSGLSHAIEFSNFSKRVLLTPISGDQYLYADRSKVQVTNRIVVRAMGGVSKEQLKRIDPRVTAVQELYKLKGCTYFVVSFNDKEDLAEILNRFETLPFIDLAQPDLLQLHEKAGRKTFQHRPIDYIKKLDIESFWQKSKGEGVKIAIIDDGFELSHEDFKGTKLSFGYDLESGTLDPSPRSAIDSHGTSVVGIIFARHNGIGINGIAPEAGLIALRHPTTWTSQTILSFYLARIAGADIINCSWKSRILLEPINDIVNDLIMTGRNGRGVVLVFSAGNGGISLAENSSEVGLPGVIAVGATDRHGIRTNFSNFGKWVDVYTYGNDIMTTSSGPEKYTLFRGTSASAAIVSGVVALLLSQDRDLSLAEVTMKLKLILGSRAEVGTEK